MDKRGLVQRHFFGPRHKSKDFQKIGLARPVNFDFEKYPAQCGFVKDFIRVEVGGKDHQRIEWNSKFFA